MTTVFLQNNQKASCTPQCCQSKLVSLENFTEFLKLWPKRFFLSFLRSTLLWKLFHANIQTTTRLAFKRYVFAQTLTLRNYSNVPLRMDYLETLAWIFSSYPNISLPYACLVSCRLFGVFPFQKPTSGGISSNLALVFFTT